MNLHDYIAKNRGWHQLWADDDMAFWIEPTDSSQYPYEVFRAERSALFNDGIMIISLGHCVSLGQAMEVWNGHINKRLEVITWSA